MITKESIIKALPSVELQTKALQLIAQNLMATGNEDALLQALGVPLLEQLHLIAAKARLSRLKITSDYRFYLVDMENREIDLQPVHKAVYLLFLAHPEGLEFKQLIDYKEELTAIYHAVAPNLSMTKIEETVARLTNPLDNAANEKCSRIKNVFLSIMDEYTASYYIIANNSQHTVKGTSHVWYTRKRSISLPRELVV